MTHFSKLFAVSLLLTISSYKCKEKKIEDFIQTTEKFSTAGGVYGSGNSDIYRFTFSKTLTDTFHVDTIFFLTKDNLCYKKLGTEEGIKYIKFKDAGQILECSFRYGEIRQPHGQTIQVTIPTHTKPERMKDNDCLLIGKYLRKNYELLIPTIKKGVNVHYQ